MDKEAIRAHLAKKFGSVKCMDTGGAVDDDDDDDDSSPAGADSVSQSSENPPPAPVDVAADLDPLAGKTADDQGPAPAPAAAPAAPPSDADKMQQMTDYLQGQYGKAADSTALKQAIANQGSQDTLANIGQAIAGLAGAGGVGAGYKQDTSVFDRMRQQAAQNVQNQGALREQSIQDFQQKNAIQQQVAQSMMAQGTYQQKQQAFQWAKDRQDPNSQTSKNAVATLQKLFPTETAGADLSNFSADDADFLSKQTDVKAKLEEAAASKRMALEMQKGRIDQQNQIKLQKDQGQAYSEMGNRIQGGRGTPGVVASALQSQQAVKNALSLVQQYPNLNEMPAQQVKLFNNELEKITTGGGGTEGGRQGLDPGTLKEAFSQLVQKFGGAPSGADVAPFIQENMKYLQDLKGNLDSTVQKYQRQTFEDYKGRLAPEDATRFRVEHPQLFPEDQAGAGQVAASQQQAPQGGAGVANAASAPAPASAALHPEAPAAYKWAKAHPDDPRAKEIMKRIGGS